VPANRQLVWEVANRLRRVGSKDEMWQLFAIQTSVQKQREMRDLLALCGEPGNLVPRQHGVEQHEPFDRSRQRRGSSKTVVRLANRVVETAVVEVKQAAPAMGAAIDRREPSAHQPPEEFANILTTDDAGEGAVLTQHADARVKHDGDEEP